MPIKHSNLGGVPKGTTANRPASPAVGDVYYNGTLGQMEIYTANGWFANSAPALAATIDSASNVGTSRAYNNGAASIAFTPNAIGGVPSAYTVTSSPGSYTATGSSSPIVVTGLQSATAYTFTMIATNSYGISQTSNASSSITATTIPNTPTSLAGDTLSQTVNLTWSAPATGGSAITDYTIQYSSNSGSSWATWSHAASNSTSAAVTGLTNGTAYIFRVAAVNANGTSNYVTSDSITPAGAPSTLEYLVVAGGGGAQSQGGGAGGGFRTSVSGATTGGGGAAESAFSVSTGTAYTVTVGAGGVGNAAGNNSVFATITSTGGGKGGGGAGGSGGGGYRAASGGTRTASPVQGYNGGNGGAGSWGGGGGGGGAGAAGGNAGGDGGSYPPGGTSGNGGIGLQSSITGSATYYAGGGGGAGDGGGSSGGLGGGGAGRNAVSGTAGTANTGGGAGAATSSTDTNGGSGIVVIRYPKAFANASSVTNGSFSNDGTYKIYTFTASGSITF